MHPLRLYTIPCLLISEAPALLFTICDYYHLFPMYREKFRPFPSVNDIKKVFRVYLRNLMIILLLGAMGMEFFIQTNTIPYDMNSELTYFTGMYQFVSATLITEFLFYWLHRYVHYNRSLYRWLHFDHHRWRYNAFALINHDLAVSEVCIFSLCPALPCITLGVHYKVMLMHAVYTNWQGSYSHSGYRFKIIDLFLLTDSRDHDNHHKHPTYNYAGGGWYSIMDRIFGTHYPFMDK